MTALFMGVLKLSFTGSYVILVVVLGRWFLKRISYSLAYVLWGVVAFRLLCPFALESKISLLPLPIKEYASHSFNERNQTIGLTQEVKQDTLEQLQFKQPLEETQSELSKETPILPSRELVTQKKIMDRLAVIWEIGVISLIGYSILSYWRLKKKLALATLIRANIYETDRITTPFVMGIVLPQIYLPTELQEQERLYILKHEQIHIQRRDYLIKLVAFITLVLHWFNPLVWLSYRWMLKDMEMSCDEIALKGCDKLLRTSYCELMFSLAKKRSKLLSPLAFGERDTLSRIKNILYYKKPSFWSVIVGIGVSILLLLGLVFNPISKKVVEVPSHKEVEELAHKEVKSLPHTSLEPQQPNFSKEAVQFLEDKLAIILSSPLESSNPQDYIAAHEIEYEELLKHMNEDTLNYMLSEFEKGNIEGLRGQLLMRLCKYLLGERDNVPNEMIPQEWFSKLKPREEVRLPNFVYKGEHPKLKLVYEAAMEKYSREDGSFTIVAPYIYGEYEEKNKLKLIVVVYAENYRLYDKVLASVGGSIIPAAITYTKNGDGTYTLEEYKEAMDGGLFRSSIEEFCTMPVSQKPIKGLADLVMNSHSDNVNELKKIQKENLIQHLQANKQYGIMYHSQDDIYTPLT
ncbi:antirepressor regulating drug resistance protein [Sporanaerobium hydrogeniformans]|uniref:Antirepressor regulating drug resistance protein n=1 Tax=Sporanaerobium hydrogeniformans TaxID=3072179 RepID=A0AC61D822_9FIRM|nr:M56 family metallopeptidase [Sporanaerobium hydrogeniformans]PHV69363.1 antirepressor regulating drug resistance protein [Sporanaerobium hydrogeniformans]